MEDRDALLARIARLETLVAEQTDVIAAQSARIAELEAELRRRGKKHQPKPNAPRRPPRPDRRTVEFRKHPGQARPDPPVAEDVVHHDVRVERCPGCGGEMTPTGDFTDHIVEDIPEPKVEVHRFRRHVCRCEECGKTAQGRNDLCVPGSHVGPRSSRRLSSGRAGDRLLRRLPRHRVPQAAVPGASVA